MAPDDPARSTPPGWEEWLRAELSGLEASALRAHRAARRRRRVLVALIPLTVLALAAALAALPRSGADRPVPYPPVSRAPSASAGISAACCPATLPGGCPNCWTTGR
ncbi:hypothetical protein KNE206_29260 [Kitasatospora sp. NE20-6]|uniref:hypothetical protein n=1 Tax=Kitasatospora sp. NE20-6 TaxID=2859066 RepID=UPI0034DCBB6C